MKEFIRTYIGIGSNLGEPIKHVRAGIAALRRLPDSRLAACSSLYRTAPVGIAAQPEFINAVCALDTLLPPTELLRKLLAIEWAHGRRRDGVRGGPRTLDLDILLYGDLQLASAEVTIPHPRLHQRAFVLIPLHEIAPALYVPGRDSVSALLPGSATETVARLSDSTIDAASDR